MTSTEQHIEIDYGPRLGGGAFGEVFEATVKPHGLVAVKVVDCPAGVGPTNWPAFRDELLAEADRLKKAEHGNVVQVFSVGPTPDRKKVLLVTELCERAIEKLIETGPLPLARAHDYVREALRGLEALHVRGMLHRDMKPANLLVKAGHAKLSDFGLVTDKIVKGYASSRGYLEHLAPEVFQTSRTSTKTDVWAMGVTTFRMLNGEPWYAAIKERLGIDWSLPRMDAHVEHLVRTGQFVKGLEWMPHVPPQWRRFVRKALHSDPAHRFQDGGEMLSAMGRLQLPRESSWECTDTPGKVTWRRVRGDREEVVEWTRHGPRRHEFVAFSQPRRGKTGRRLTLDSSGGIVGKTKAMRDLQACFADRSM